MNEKLEHILRNFLDQAQTSNLTTSHYPDSYLGLDLKVSFGKGNQAKIPWISFLGENQTTANGIYPVYLLYKEENTLILAYGVSETIKPELSWDLKPEIKTIRQYFEKLNITPFRYGDSFISEVYDINSELNWDKMETDLQKVINEYKNNLSNINILQNNKMKSINLDFKFISIKTKPFIILAGLSGTGKSRLTRSLAYQFNNIEEDKRNNINPPTNFQMIKVKPNWHDSSELLGYESRISGKDRFITTDFIRFIVKAWQYPSTPFFLCLDEMNLAPVEQYFAEYLSVIESRQVSDNGQIRTDSLIDSTLIRKYATNEDGVDENFNLWNELILTDEDLQKQFTETGLTLPPNLIVMGTVNMDETTHSFSRKVLDRAMTIEMNEINLESGLDDSANEWRYAENPLPSNLVIAEKTHGFQVYDELGESGKTVIEYLQTINSILENSPFKIAYRVRDEFLLYAYNYSQIEDKTENWLDEVLDKMTLMKILPRIEGDEDKTESLEELIDLFKERNFHESLAKAEEMQNRRERYHYTSFWT